jgi:hypothetical protein
MNPNQNDEGFFITLASNLCLDMYRENSNVDFINYLWKPIELNDDWCVGLVSIDYSDSFLFEGVSEDPRHPDNPKVPEKANNATTPSLQGITVPTSFLGTDNKIVVDLIEKNKADFFKREGETFLAFLVRLKHVIDQFLSKSVEFETEYDGVSPEPTVIITVKKSPEGRTFLRLTPKLSYVLGFGSQIDFLEGETIRSPEQAKESRMSDSLINEEDLPITLVKITTKPIEILKPESFEVDVLIEAIVTTMDTNGYYVEMAVSPDDYLTVTPIFNPYQFSFRLPAVINKALGLSESFVFTGPEQILLDSKKQEETTTIKPKSERKRDQLLKSATSCQIIVETSIVEESNFGPYAQKI